MSSVPKRPKGYRARIIESTRGTSNPEIQKYIERLNLPQLSMDRKEVIRSFLKQDDNNKRPHLAVPDEDKELQILYSSPPTATLPEQEFDKCVHDTLIRQRKTFRIRVDAKHRECVLKMHMMRLLLQELSVYLDLLGESVDIRGSRNYQQDLVKAMNGYINGFLKYEL